MSDIEFSKRIDDVKRQYDKLSQDIYNVYCNMYDKVGDLLELSDNVDRIRNNIFDFKKLGEKIEERKRKLDEREKELDEREEIIKMKEKELMKNARGVER